MGLESTSDKLLVITHKEDSIAVRLKNDSAEEDTFDETIQLENFFNTYFNNNNVNLKLDKMSVLELPNCELTDLPISFENLNLKYLNLTHNTFKIVPACIFSGLKQLEYLDLGHNMIENFDNPPGCLRVIKTVKLNNNSLSSIPKWIINFRSTNIEELNFSCNKAVHYNYNKNSCNIHVMKLKKLKLRNSHLIDADFNFLKCFQHLEYLDVSNKYNCYINKLYEADYLFVKPKWKQLKVLKMNNLSISLFPEGIPWIESLTHLYLNQNYISWFPDDIEFMVNLEFLDISQNTLVAIPEKVAKLESLKVLLVSGNSIEVCPDLRKMLSLKFLDLYDNLLESIEINCDILEGFDLDQNYLATKDFNNYEVKKRNLRRSSKLTQIRSNEQKIQAEYSDSSSDRRTDSDEEHIYETTTVTVIANTLDETENWDLPPPPKMQERNSDIDSEDEAWQGEEKFTFMRRHRFRKKIYVDDEDWMFEDVEEIL